MQKLIRLLASSLFLLLLTPFFNPSFASYTAGCGSGINTVWTLDCVFPLMANLISALLGFSAVVAVVLIIYSGIKFMFSGGDPKQIESTRNILMYAILGLVLVFSSFAIISFISYVTGVACLSPSSTSVVSFHSCTAKGGGGSGDTVSQCNPECITPQTCQYNSSSSMYTCK